MGDRRGLNFDSGWVRFADQDQPRRPLDHKIEAIFKLMPRIQPLAFCISPTAMDDHYTREPKMGRDRTKLQAKTWYQNGRLRVIGCLKSLPSVRDCLEDAAPRKGIEFARGKVLSVIAWWLDPKCPACDGRRCLVAPGHQPAVEPHVSAAGYGWVWRHRRAPSPAWRRRPRDRSADDRQYPPLRGSRSTRWTAATPRCSGRGESAVIATIAQRSKKSSRLTVPAPN